VTAGVSSAATSGPATVAEPPAVSGPETDSFDQAFATFGAELERLLPEGTVVVDAHTHLGLDEDGRSLDLAGLLEELDQISPTARACVFPLHDPARHPAYTKPNDRVLAWAAESGGRLIPFCRLDPTEGPVAEAKRCIAHGARGIKLHPRAQSFGFGNAAADSIFAVASDAGVPILIHAGRGMPTMEPLADLALRYPEVPLILAHAAIADQGLLTSRLAGHPAILYDTSVFAALDVVELFARVPAERIVFGSDPPYGRSRGGLFLALRAAAYAGLGDHERALVSGGTMAGLIADGRLPEPQPPRLARARPANGSLQRVTNYLMMGFGGVMGVTPPAIERALPGIALARTVCRDPDPGAAGPALERIDAALEAAEALIAAGEEQALSAVGLVHAALVVAATETVE
jgi:uncharacterized protein